ncbi:hypothetical protein GRI75_07325 [Altererythrobacter soli]|uniref:Polymerase/histidinol phosphatase N-terminal domain-containing protein n=1 Tax=Croceibacterium soli TaxID=1739690 RepID=A0A6I4URC9_9SPHN|nr:CehA/McbA family metallohydrolase [Croceibacterium soli]MXP41452.1 hypothetical protein [Croceibacterium soli]
MLGLAHYSVAAQSAPELHWYRGNTHTHTVNSDGDTAPDGVVRWYRENGYQFLFVTDHEFATDVAPLNALFGAEGRFLVLPGQEITQWGEDPARSAAHVNSLFTTRVIWPVGERRCTGSGCGAHAPAAMPLAETFRANIAAVRAQNGIAQVNHPNYRWSVRPEDLDEIPDGTLLEIWNGLGSVNDLGGSDGNGDVRPSAEGYWDYLLSRGKVVWGVGSDDSHNAEGRGHAWIVVRASELTPAAIRAGIERGDFYASTGVTLTDIAASDAEFAVTIEPARSGARYTTRFIGQDGKVLAEAAGTSPRYRFTGNETYVRAAITDSNGKHAWTQPVFRDGRGQTMAPGAPAPR